MKIIRRLLVIIIYFRYDYSFYSGKHACLLQAFAQGTDPHDTETWEKAERRKQPLQRLYSQLPNHYRDVKKQVAKEAPRLSTDWSELRGNICFFKKRKKYKNQHMIQRGACQCADSQSRGQPWFQDLGERTVHIPKNSVCKHVCFVQMMYGFWGKQWHI